MIPGKPGTIRSSAYRAQLPSYLSFQLTAHQTDVPHSMKYSPSETGHFDGQRGYGYISIEKFIDAARSVNAGETSASEFDKHGLPTIRNTVLTTAILNAGRISLDEKRPVGIKKNGDQWILE
jgi:D-galacturonate reductase